MATLADLEQALINADAAGDVEAAKALAAAIQKYRGVDESYSAGDVARAAAQGLTFGFGDEIEAGVRSLFPGNTYIGERDRIRGEIERFRENHPGKSLTAEIAGGMVTGGAGGARALGSAALRNAPRMLSLPLVGAVEGAVAGAGYAPEVKDIPLSSATGAVVGAVSGAFGRLLEKGGRAILDRFPKKQAERKLMEALQRDGYTVDSAIQRLDELGPEGSIAELGPNLRGLARQAATRPGKSRQIAEDMLRTRQQGQQKRIMDAAEEATGLRGNYYEKADELLRTRKTKADRAYNRAARVPVEVTDEMIERVSRKSGKQALKTAADAYNNRTGKTVDLENLEGITDLRFWDEVKRALDVLDGSKASPAFPSEVSRNVANSIKENIKRPLVGELDIQNKAYPVARKVYERPSRLLDAMDEGRKLFSKKDSELVDRALSQMDDKEKKHFIIGALRELKYRVNRGPDSANQARNLIKSPDFREKLAKAFPDDASFETFLKRMEAETEMGETYSAIMHGSRTTPMLSERADAASPIGMIADLLRGDLPALGSGVMRMGSQNALMPQNVADSLAGLLFTQGQQAMPPLLSAANPGVLSPYIVPSLLGVTANKTPYPYAK